MKYIFLPFIIALLSAYNIKGQTITITEQDAIAFAKNIENTIKAEDPTFTNNIFDASLFTKRIVNQISGVDTTGAFNTIKNAMSKLNMGDKILADMGDDGNYLFVKQYEKNGERHIIFRLFGGAAVNYHDIELVKLNGQVKAIDMYIYLSGENFSKTFADLMGSLMQNKNSGSVYNLRKVKHYISTGEYEDALAAFKKLDKVKETKAGQLIYLQILSALNEDTKYVKAMNSYRKNFPGDPSLHLVLIDYYYLKKDYNKTLDEIDALDNIINTDPFLDYYRGLMYNSMDNVPDAIKCFERLNKFMPDFANPKLELIILYLINGDTNKAKTFIDNYRADYGDEDLKLLAISYPQYEEQLLFKK